MRLRRVGKGFYLVLLNLLVENYVCNKAKYHGKQACGENGIVASVGKSGDSKYPYSNKENNNSQAFQ